MRVPALGLVLALAGGASALAANAPAGVIYAGGASNTPSGYAGGLISLPGSELGHGWAVSGTVIGGEYDYQGGVGQVKADYTGGGLALAYQSSGGWGWADVSAGPQYVDTRLKPFDPSNKRAGGRWTALLQADGELYAKVWRVGWYGQVGASDGGYDFRLRLNRSVGGERLRLGAAASVQGDPTYRVETVGPTLDIQPIADFTVQIAAGARLQQDIATRGYVSLGVSKVF